ncbi:MAG: T9SS type A sorting domain-containing protein [Candidatus Cloacimonetes bacterium]|nr:T9SS type A sorting domain-containing protein [Candidatus Cloacimonadota bacterium]
MKNFNFKKIDFQFTYLSLLTKERIKPLSRWEIKITSKELKLLKYLGLKAELIPRKLKNGRTIYETVFSKSRHYLEYYEKFFSYKPIDHQKKDMKTEGFLFGYPSCCVNNFIENGYTSNNFQGKEQELLFHWICPECRITPSLFKYYRNIHDECEELVHSETPKNSIFSKALKRSIPVAAAILMGVVAPQLNADEHWLPVVGDTDNDFLTYKEEILLGTDSFYIYPSSADSIAKIYKTVVDSLPREVLETECYAVDNYAYGFYTCQICGETANMGYVTIHNPLRQLEMNIPYMMLHFMEHGSFSSIIQGDTLRVDIELIKKILAPFDIEHLNISTENDDDNDGLNNPAEIHFETDQGNPQTHNLGIDDGQEISEAIIKEISDLPEIIFGQTPPTDVCYLTYLQANGVETCSICGNTVNMGLVIVNNPMLENELFFPIIGLHYMSHGRFAFSGTHNQGEVDPIQLAAILNIDFTSISNLSIIAEKYGYQILNYPNPFNPSTTISFSTTFNYVNTEIIVYNVKGKKVKKLINEHLPAGIHSVIWDGTDEIGNPVSSGIYLYKLKNGRYTVTKKMILMK